MAHFGIPPGMWRMRVFWDVNTIPGLGGVGLDSNTDESQRHFYGVQVSLAECLKGDRDRLILSMERCPHLLKLVLAPINYNFRGITCVCLCVRVLVRLDGWIHSDMFRYCTCITMKRVCVCARVCVFALRDYWMDGKSERVIIVLNAPRASDAL